MAVVPWRTVLAASLFLLGFAVDGRAQGAFDGYHCTEDCSGHQAGYDWAEVNGIAEPSDCGGNSQSFIQGCQSYAEENAGSSDEDASYEDEDQEPGDEGDSE